MNKQAPLVSIFITYYNTGDIIYETIDSVLEQDYPNIELIVSDDASSRVPMGDIDSYIEEKRRHNIQRVLVRRNEENLGTVKHVEVLHGLCHGEFCCGIAGDDLFNDSHVISTMVAKFEELGPDAEYMIAQVEMFDQHMEKSYGLCVQNSTIQLLKEQKWEALLNHEASACRLVGQNMSRTSLYKRMPKASEAYVLVEDYSTHMRLLHMGIPIYWCDIVMVKHRGGGMSHGNMSNKPEVYIKYCQDYMTIFELEIEPYRQELDPECYKQAVETYRYFVWQKETTEAMGRHRVLCRMFALHNPQTYSEFLNMIKGMASPDSLCIWTISAALMVLAYTSIQRFAQNMGILRISVATLMVLLIVAVLLRIGAICLFQLYKWRRRRHPILY